MSWVKTPSVMVGLQLVGTQRKLASLFPTSLIAGHWDFFFFFFVFISAILGRSSGSERTQMVHSKELNDLEVGCLCSSLTLGGTHVHN